MFRAPSPPLLVAPSHVPSRTHPHHPPYNFPPSPHQHSSPALLLTSIAMKAQSVCFIFSSHAERRVSLQQQTSISRDSECERLYCPQYTETLSINEREQWLWNSNSQDKVLKEMNQNVNIFVEQSTRNKKINIWEGEKGREKKRTVTTPSKKQWGQNTILQHWWHLW